LDNFLEQRSGIKRRELILGGKPLDLHLLYKAVLDRGGFKRMASEAEKKKGVWASVFRSLPNYNENETSASFRLRKSYEKYLLEFELSERGLPLPRRAPQDNSNPRRKRKRDGNAANGSAPAQKKGATAAAAKVRAGAPAAAPVPTDDPGASKQDEGEAAVGTRDGAAAEGDSLAVAAAAESAGSAGADAKD
jgi:hypothetical protein